MKHGSLFSGMGGFDLAAQWMDWENIFHCEWNPFGQRILKYYWPKAISYADITKTDFSIHRGNIDILTGGFPCQPYSVAGQRKGKDDERHLWPHMLRAIREIKPRWVVGENVLGLVNWNEGLVFEEVQADLEAEGYEVQPYILPAASVNAPHKRDRVWFVAHSNNDGRPQNSERKRIENSEDRHEYECLYLHEAASNPDGLGLRGQSDGIRKSRFFNKDGKIYDWENFPTQSPICNGNDGIPTRLDLVTVFEGFDKPLTFSKWRNESIKAGGNAVVPELVYEIFGAIEEYERIA